MSDLFNVKNISPMLISENVAPFENDQYLYEMKWDGERCIAYLDPNVGTELRNKRQVRMLPKVPELAEIHRQAKSDVSSTENCFAWLMANRILKRYNAGV